LEQSKFFTYKNRPLVRKGDTIYYGNMSDDFVAILHIQQKEDFSDLKIAKQITLQLMNTDPSLPPQECIVKKSDKKNLFQALDVADIWLSRSSNA